MNDATLSLENIVTLRGKASAAIRKHTVAVTSIAAALGDLDFALQRSIDERSIDQEQILVTAARTLAALLESGVRA